VDRFLVRKAVEKKIVSKEEDARVRDLMPSDLGGISGEVWVQRLSGGSWHMVYSGKNPDNRIFVIYGVRALSAVPNTVGIKFRTPTDVKDVWATEPGFSDPEDPVVIGNNRIVYENNETFIIEMYGKEAREDYVAFLGRVVEPAGVTVS